MLRDERRRISKHYEESVGRNWTLLIDSLEPRVISDALVQEGILKIEDNGYIKDIKHINRRVQKLMEIIIRSGDQKFEVFLNVLPRYGYGFIAEAIKSTYQKLQDATPTASVEPKCTNNGSRDKDEHEGNSTLDSHSDHKLKGEDVADSRRPVVTPQIKEDNVTTTEPNPHIAHVVSLTGYQDAMSFPPSHDYETIPCCLATSPPHSYTGLSLSENSSQNSDVQIQNISALKKDQSSSVSCSEPSSSNEDEPIYANESDITSQQDIGKRLMLREALSLSGSKSHDKPLPSHFQGAEYCSGWNATISDKEIKPIAQQRKHKDGSYCLWYSNKNRVLVLTVIKSSAKGGCLHFKIKTTEEKGQQVYFLEKESKFTTLNKLLDFTITNGLSEKS